MGVTLENRNKTGDMDGCAAMKDGLHVAERSVYTWVHLLVCRLSFSAVSTIQRSR